MVAPFDYQEYLASRDWALLKNKVRERSGGICERCRQAPYQSTHHKTYARIGRELMEDLLGVCNPCHEYLSGKSDHDPTTIPTLAPAPTKVPPVLNSRGQQMRGYFAGKIAKQDWRHSIFPGLDRVATNSDIEVEDISGGHHSYVGSRTNDPAVAKLEADGILYGGPYFVGCDHGGFHGESSHGQGADSDVLCCATSGIFRPYILDECSRLISQSDFVFCWLDSADAYGTIFELGFARALKIPVFLFHPFGYFDAPKWWGDMWLAVHAAYSVHPLEDPIQAWQFLVKHEAPYLS